jgi:mRNA interferase RelE/StbE
VRIRWSEIALASAARFIADQDGMHAINAAVAALADDPEPPGAFVRGPGYRRLHVGDYRVLYSLEWDRITKN